MKSNRRIQLASIIAVIMLILFQYLPRTNELGLFEKSILFMGFFLCANELLKE